MPFASRVEFNEYRRFWRAQQKARRQGVATPRRTMANPAPAVVSESAMPVTGVRAMPVIPVHPNGVMHSDACWACLGSGLSSNSTACSYCQPARPAPSGPEPIAAVSVPSFASGIIPVVIIVGIAFGAVWLISKFSSRGVVASLFPEPAREWTHWMEGE
jgi:hypothetical protein